MPASLAQLQTAPVASPVPHIDVCVATYRRPGRLAALLSSLRLQETEGAFTYRVIVVDNDRLRSGASTVRRFAAEGFDIRYALEPRQSIALARNLGFSLSTGELIATIDDDEVAPPDWLLQLLRAMRAHDADVVRGRVAYVFTAQPSRLVRRSRAFDFPNPRTGATEGFPMGTGNTLIRRSALPGHSPIFDPDLGRTGGSDSELFLRMKAAGLKVIWSREATSLELVPPERSTWRAVLVREFRLGNNFYPVRHKAPQAVGSALFDVAREFVAMLRCAIGSPWRRRRLTQALVHFRLAVRSSGRLGYVLGVRIERYTETGPRLVLEKTRLAGG